MVGISTVVITDTGPIIHLDELESLDLLTDFGKARFVSKAEIHNSHPNLHNINPLSQA